MHGRVWMLSLLFVFSITGNYTSVYRKTVPIAEFAGTETILISEQMEIFMKEEKDSYISSAVKAEELLNNNKDAGVSEEDIDLIALVTMAEAEGESEYGKRLVIDTILNRVDSEYYPNTVFEVVYQPDQFSSIWNGRADRCYVTDEIR